ncbi:PepSY domain-containing protein [Alteribacter aurantiacus]|uniref:PepSY domain-containing protein n=1 Tax=Alteribacter aurantiacus TaxID=254410 RepID=UPI00042A6A87|nr:PepSY domain-containing protein [Alteribacter aurantiacus]
MSWKRFIAGVGVGVAVAWFAKDQLEQTSCNLSPERALKLVKRKMKDFGTIDGSWIHMMAEDFKSDNLTYSVYRGGVSCTIDGKLHAFEFLVDASTGTILKLKRQED